jgi:hypothetical protein
MTTLLDSLIGTPMWIALDEELTMARNTRIKRLVSGQCSYEEYLSVSGEVRGIDITLNLNKGDKK